MHIVSLDTIGGVEALFAHYLEACKEPQQVLVMGRRVHDHFRQAISGHRLWYAKRVPRWLRPLYMKWIYRRAQPTNLLLWNRLELVPPPRPCKHPCRVIYYEHGASWMTPSDRPLDSFWNQVDAIAANSEAAAQLLRLKWKVPHAIEVIPNPLRPDIVCAAAGHLPRTPLRLGYAGRLLPIKGVSQLLQALPLCEGTTLTIAGEGPDRPRLERLVCQLGLQQRVLFCGAVRNMASWYDAIDVLVVPSIREPLGLVALEAAARGCPSIAARVDGLPEVVLHGRTGFTVPPTLELGDYPQEGLPDLVYDPDSQQLVPPRLCAPEALAEAIVQCNDPARFQTMSGHAIEMARARSDFGAYVAAISGITSWQLLQ